MMTHATAKTLLWLACLILLAPAAGATVDQGPTVPTGKVELNIHDHDGAPVADLSLTGPAAKALYDFLTNVFAPTGYVANGELIEEKQGYGIFCFKGTRTLEAGKVTVRYACTQRIQTDGEVLPGGVDPMIGGGN